MATSKQNEHSTTLISQAALIVAFERAQELVCARITALQERAEDLRRQVEEGGGSVNMLFTDEFAKETGNWPRPVDYIEA